MPKGTSKPNAKAPKVKVLKGGVGKGKSIVAKYHAAKGMPKPL